MMSSPVSKVYTRNALDHETIKDSFFPQLLQQMFVLQQNKCQFAFFRQAAVSVRRARGDISV